MNTQPGALAFDRSASYRICVQGVLSAAWADRLMGMVIRRIQFEGEPPYTLLEGSLVDQAALIGVLLTLYELHLPVQSVECTGTVLVHPKP
jgi:hypothetical protein